MYEIYARLRDEKGLNDYRVSKATGISAASLSDWKHGKSTPKADKLRRLADFFGVSIRYLMGLQIEKAEEKQEANIQPIREYLVKTEEMELLIEEAERHSPENLKLIVEMLKKNEIKRPGRVKPGQPNAKGRTKHGQFYSTFPCVNLQSERKSDEGNDV